MKPPKAAPGSIRHSILLLLTVGAAAIALLALTDGLPAAAVGTAVLTSAGLLVARFTIGGGAQDSGYRRSVRLLGSSTPGIGQWEWILVKRLGPDGEAHFAATLLPKVRRLFAARLAERHGVEMDRAPQRARALVGPELWPWLDPAAPSPAGPLTEPVLRALIDRLEALDTPDAIDPDARPTHPAPREQPVPYPDKATGDRGQAQ